LPAYSVFANIPSIEQEIDCNMQSKLSLDDKMRLAILPIIVLALVSSTVAGATIRGYVIDEAGNRVAGARVQAWHMVSPDQRPVQQPTKLGETTADAHGDFVISVDAPEINMLVASFDHQSGAAAPPFSSTVRIVIRRVHLRPIL
jgi:hypothetical protein